MRELYTFAFGNQTTRNQEEQEFIKQLKNRLELKTLSANNLQHPTFKGNPFMSACQVGSQIIIEAIFDEFEIDTTEKLKLLEFTDLGKNNFLHMIREALLIHKVNIQAYKPIKDFFIKHKKECKPILERLLIQENSAGLYIAKEIDKPYCKDLKDLLSICYNKLETSNEKSSNKESFFNRLRRHFSFKSNNSNNSLTQPLLSENEEKFNSGQNPNHKSW